ncbi:MAG: hypothetical protein ABF689_13820, partial [Gluconobacter cerinus]|uniref:hypothetical protein n=1 Tax=Gluconobacter cerinus TaxID=38307 RepID=UPI0039E7C871
VALYDTNTGRGKPLPSHARARVSIASFLVLGSSEGMSYSYVQFEEGNESAQTSAMKAKADLLLSPHDGRNDGVAASPKADIRTDTDDGS